MATRNDKVINGSNLGHLWQKIRAAFWGKDETTEISIDSTPTANSTNVVTSGGVKAALDSKQNTLVSGTDIKTINNQTILGSGNLQIDTSNVVQHTTAYWDAATGYVPADGEIVVYTDYSTITETVEGQTVTKYVPGIKIGSGNGYVQDLAFVGEDVKNDIIAHLTNTSIHIQTGERDFWNNKLNVNDNQEVVNEVLILNRN